MGFLPLCLPLSPCQKVLIPVLILWRIYLMPDTFFSHFSGYPLSCLLSGFIIIEADVYLLDVGAILQHLPQNLVRYTAGCRITLAFPAVLEHGGKGQHINRCFEEIQPSPPPCQWKLYSGSLPGALPLNPPCAAVLRLWI